MSETDVVSGKSGFLMMKSDKMKTYEHEHKYGYECEFGVLMKNIFIEGCLELMVFEREETKSA